MAKELTLVNKAVTKGLVEFYKDNNLSRSQFEEIAREAVKLVFDKIEKRFNTDHFCQEHEKWCDCWNTFKEECLK